MKKNYYNDLINNEAVRKEIKRRIIDLIDNDEDEDDMMWESINEEIRLYKKELRHLIVNNFPFDRDEVGEIESEYYSVDDVIYPMIEKHIDEYKDSFADSIIGGGEFEFREDRSKFEIYDKDDLKEFAQYITEYCQYKTENDSDEWKDLYKIMNDNVCKFC